MPAARPRLPGCLLICGGHQDLDLGMSRELGVLRTYLVHSAQETLYSSFVCIFFLGVSTGGLEFVVLLSQPPSAVVASGVWPFT